MMPYGTKNDFVVAKKSHSDERTSRIGKNLDALVYGMKSNSDTVPTHGPSQLKVAQNASPAGQPQQLANEEK